MQKQYRMLKRYRVPGLTDQLTTVDLMYCLFILLCVDFSRGRIGISFLFLHLFFSILQLLQSCVILQTRNHFSKQ